jgi:hypothetical protein
MKPKRNILEVSVLASALAVGGCASIPAGHTLVTENDHVVWEAFGQPKLERSPEFSTPASRVATTTWEFPGHPIYGAWSAPVVAAQPLVRRSAASRADTAFLRELARSDGDATGESVETPPETAVASR